MACTTFWTWMVNCMLCNPLYIFILLFINFSSFLKQLFSATLHMTSICPLPRHSFDFFFLSSFLFSLSFLYYCPFFIYPLRPFPQFLPFPCVHLSAMLSGLADHLQISSQFSKIIKSYVPNSIQWAANVKCFASCFDYIFFLISLQN